MSAPLQEGIGAPRAIELQVAPRGLVRAGLPWVVAIGLLGSASTFLDHLQMTSGVLSYPAGVQPWWVPVEFGLACIGTLLGVEPARRLLRGLSITRSHLLGDAVSFPIAWLITSYFQASSVVLMVTLVAWWLSRVVERPRWVLWFCLACALWGLLSESLLCTLGVFRYEHPDLMGVTLWLPAIYLHAGLLGTSLSAALRKTSSTG